MHMRFVHLQVKEGRSSDLARFYEERVIAALEGTEGCLFASLLQPSSEPNENISMTLWESREAADAYEESGLYDLLLDESDDYLAEATEWRIRLTGDRGGPFSTLQDPPVEGYPVQIIAEKDAAAGAFTPRMYIGIMAARIEAGRFPQLAARFNEEVVPAMMAARGCRAVFLVEGLRARSRALFVSIWESEEAASRWRRTGKLGELTSRLSEFFSGLYQWELSLTADRAGRGVRPRDLDFSEYRVITGSRLGEGQTV